jgi:hypothetical protein
MKVPATFEGNSTKRREEACQEELERMDQIVRVQWFEAEELK